MNVERVDFVNVATRDAERSRAWYREMLGLDPVDERGFPEYRLGENVSVYLLNLEQIGSTFTGPHTASIALRVPDVAAARAELETRGVSFEGDTLDTGVCHMAHFKDPDGNVLMLHRRYAPRS